ncbi:MAG: lamin tail domain-containing protein, partial [Candidatus Neomarinimicrobiota bacterium]
AAYNIYDFMPEPGPAANLIFSEYIEGSSNNKAIEIANVGQIEADLAQYRIAQSVNGKGWQYYHHFPFGAYIEPGIPYVILNSSVHDTLYNKDWADEVLDYPSVVHHNGDDARAIIRVVRGDTTILDVFGDPDNDPGSGMDVDGVSAATKDHTLIRKGNVSQGVTEPLLSFGSDEASSEWEVRPKNDFSDLGYHGPSGPPTVIFRVNTSTMPDTLQDYHFMQIRGGFVGPDVADAASSGMITWDSMSRHMYNEGGDYWWADFPMSPGDTLNYKFWAGVNPDTPLINGSEQGWESGGNNQFILPADFAEEDTVVALQFYETREAPYTSHEDSISVYFKV